MMTVAIFLIFFLFVVEVFRNCLLQKRADLPPYKRWSYLSYNNSQKYLDEKRFKRIQNTDNSENNGNDNRKIFRALTLISLVFLLLDADSHVHLRNNRIVPDNDDVTGEWVSESSSTSPDIQI